MIRSFNNSILLVLSAERIDPKKLYGDQKGFHRYTDKVTGLRGFILGINQVKMEGEKQATVIYSYHSNMHSGGSSFATLTNLKNKWEVAKVKGGYKY